MENLKDKPFALIGVNSDPRKTAQNADNRAKITWRSFWDGGTSQGPIATKWNAQGWPTMYILDAQGRIRFKSIGPMDDLTAKVEQVLKET